MQQPGRSGWSFGLPLALLVLLGGCREAEPPAAVASYELTILTRNAPTTYYVDRHGGLAGLEYELASEFARAMDLQPRFEVLDSIDEILRAIGEGRGDLAAAGLTRTPAREERFLFGPDYQTIEERVVCGPGVGVQRLTDLVGKRLRVIASSSYEETLSRLRERVPELEWTATTQESTEQLLQQAWQGRLDCTVTDSNILAIDRRFMPELKTPLAVGEEETLAWIVADRRRDLLRPLGEWFQSMRRSGRLQELLDKYYRHLERFDYVDTAAFLRRQDERLPRYREFFAAASEETGLAWSLLAAVSYQESHWDPEAASPTGVRGLMMLTRETAGSLGVSDRKDPQQSIVGGARSLRGLLDRIPPFIPEPDRLWMALAAYNVGFGHLQDAQTLAVESGRNPNTWSGVEAVLPLLSQGRYYRRLRHGYARGHEPVVYVQRIRNYYDLLEQRAAQETPPGPGVEVASSGLER